tara:strand:- start:279 stop:1040 length:762 start_codon:yes stop_codon:yes gene_type:complete
MSKILLMDIGNTRIKWGVLENRALSGIGSLLTPHSRDFDLKPLFISLPSDVKSIVASCVLSKDIQIKLAEFFFDNFELVVEFIEPKNRFFGLTNGYTNPSKLGTDRWAAMIGAHNEFGGNILVVDMGTAITIDYINAEGVHKGGQILPGLKSFFNILDQSTGSIDTKINISDTAAQDIKKWGKNTDDAVISGAMSAISGAINAAVFSFKIEDSMPSVILTGGDAIYFKDVFDYSLSYRPNLVLEGLAIILGEE